jgi:hypothetical protein
MDPVPLEKKEQAKLDTIAAEFVAAQQTKAQLQEQLVEASEICEQQRGRMQGALETVLDRYDLDPATYRWDYNGNGVVIHETGEV